MHQPVRSVFQGATSIIVLSLVAFGIAACSKTSSLTDVTGAIKTATTPSSDAGWRQEAEILGDKYRINPRDADIAIKYAKALRTTGQLSQASAVLQQATLHNPNNRKLLGEYGRSLAEVGNYSQALEILSKAHSPDQPDWHILSVQGAVLDQLGQHREAQRYYASALKIVPDEPSVLSNLGLSYALSKDLHRAEVTLRRAAARSQTDSRIRQNLALVIGLQGRFSEAEELARADLPPQEATANVSYLKQVLVRQDGLKNKLQLHGPSDKL